MTKYIQQQPMPKQRIGLLLDDLEVFYGGAAGGGKSSWLLMAALQYVDVRGYHALILRSSIKDADNPGSVLYRSRQWLGGRNDVVWNGKQTAWIFPSGAVLQFGYLSQKNDKYQYDSAEYQFVGFDELTHFWETDYEYLFTRLRGPRCRTHFRDNERGRAEKCVICQSIHDTGLVPLMHVPLRMRAASNPGSKGHNWVQERFQIRPIPGKLTPGGRQLYAGTHPNRVYIPAFLEDNDYIDQESYRGAIQIGVRDQVTKYQKIAGDWGVRAEGRFKRDWIQRYKIEGSFITLATMASWQVTDCSQFVIVDPAASRKATPGEATKQLTNKQASFTAITRWLITPAGDLCLMAAERHQVEAAEIARRLQVVVRKYPVMFIGMEYTAMSIHLYTILQGMRLPMKGMKPRSIDKIQRSVDAQTRMEEGKLWLPSGGGRWLEEFEDEVFSWTGDPDEVDDQVDCLSYAAMYLTENPVGMRRSLPQVVR